jgi:hypothetical protein
MQFKKLAMDTQARRCHSRPLHTPYFSGFSGTIPQILSGLAEIVLFSLADTLLSLSIFNFSSVVMD